VEHQDPPLDDRRYWPHDMPLPEVYQRQRIPCPECRRLHLDDGWTQAVVAMSVRSDLAYFRCRGCEHRFKMVVSSD